MFAGLFSCHVVCPHRVCYVYYISHDTVKPPATYTRQEFHNTVLPRASEKQPPRVLNELRQLSCRLVASGITRGLLSEEDLSEIRKTLVSRFQVNWRTIQGYRDTGCGLGG